MATTKVNNVNVKKLLQQVKQTQPFLLMNCLKQLKKKQMAY